MMNILDSLNFINPLRVINSYLSASTFNWAAAAAVAASAIQSRQASKAAKAQQAAAADASKQAAFAPYNVSGAFGQSTFDPKNNTAGVELTPEMQQLQDLFGQQATQFAGQGQTQIGDVASQGGLGFLQGAVQNDPYQLAQSQFQKMDEILAPSRQRQREALESRLLRQGRLGSTGGSLQQQGFESAIEESRQRGLFDALGQAKGIQAQDISQGTQLGLFGQQQQDVGFNQAQARLGAVSGIDQNSQRLLELGAGLGGRQATAGAYQGAFGMRGAAAGSAAQLGAAAGLAQAAPKIGGALSDYFNQPQSNNYSGISGVNQGSQQDLQLAEQNAGFNF